MLGDMNRSEQENLYRTSRKLSLVPIAGNHSHANVFDSDRRRTSTARALPYAAPTVTEDSAKSQEAAYTQQDLVLSVLKSPVNHVGFEQREMTTQYGVPAGSEVALCGETPDEDPRYLCVISGNDPSKNKLSPVVLIFRLKNIYG